MRTLRHEGAVLEGGLLQLSAPFFQLNPHFRVVSHDGATASFQRGRTHVRAVRIRCHLIGHDDRAIESIGKSLELVQMAVQCLLPRCQFAATREFGSKVRHDAVDDDEAKLTLLAPSENLRRGDGDITLVLKGQRTHAVYVAKNLFGVCAHDEAVV